MQIDRDTRRAAVEPLNALAGEWSLRASFPPTAPASLAADTLVGRVVFEWVLGGAFLAEHAEIPHPGIPDSTGIIGFDPDSGAYTQHYFDSRGVTRIYAMTLGEGTWTLLRDAPDFTPLDFSQRFTGTFGDDRRTIAGRWETRPDSGWEHDFDLIYTQVS
jgi:hypothetical protein